MVSVREKTVDMISSQVNQSTTSLQAPNTAPLNVVIVGNGAIGSIWCYHLIQNPAINVSLLTKSQQEQTEATEHENKTKPLCFTQLNGFSFQYHCQLANEKTLAEADLLIVCVKSYDCADLVNQLCLRSPLSANADIVLCHNGMGVYEAIDEQVKKRHAIYGALTTHGGFRPSAYHTIHTGLGTMDLGKLSSDTDNKLNAQPPAWFTQISSHFANTFWHQNIKLKQWQKLAVNCVINPVTAINNVRNGEVANHKYLSLIQQIAEEVANAAQSQGIGLSAEYIVEQALKVATATANNISSTLADVRAMRTTEITAINGYICELAKNNGFAAPVNAVLTQQVTAL